MALDTRNKRFSMMGFKLPNPDGTISQADRQQLLGFYSGILWAEGGETATGLLSLLIASGEPDVTISG